MKTISVRNTCFLLAVAGALSLAACQTTDESMEAPEPAPAVDDSMTQPTPPPAEEPMSDPTEEVPAAS